MRFYWHEFATFNSKPAKLAINTTNEGAVVEGLVLGHPDVLRSMNSTLK